MLLRSAVSAVQLLGAGARQPALASMQLGRAVQCAVASTRLAARGFCSTVNAEAPATAAEAPKAAASESGPKAARSSYIFFYSSKREEIKASLGSNNKPADVAREAGRLWKQLTDAERAPFEKMAADDKQRFIAEGGKVAVKTAAPAGGDGPVPPKPAPSAYLLFTLEKLPEVKAANPDLTNPELFSKIGRLWRELSDADKKPFEAKAAVAKAEAAAAKQAFIAEHGPIAKTAKK